MGVSSEPLLRPGDLAPRIELPDEQGRATPLVGLWQERPLLLVFLRHFGCPPCREFIARIRNDRARFEAEGAQIATIGMGFPDQAARFKEQLALPFPVLCDPKQEAYRAFGIQRGGLNAIAGPRMWWKGLWAFLRRGGGKPVGDVFQLPGAFVIDRNGVIRLAHYFSLSTDYPDHEAILAAIHLTTAAAKAPPGD